MNFQQILSTCKFLHIHVLSNFFIDDCSFTSELELLTKNCLQKSLPSMKLSGQHIGFHELRHWYDNFHTQSDQPV